MLASLSFPTSDLMFDTSFLQVVVFVVAGALLVGPKDLPVVARKLGGLLGKGVGFVGRTRSNVQSFIKENELTHVQHDFERSLQQIRQVQDEVKQGLTSPIGQTIHRHGYTNHAHSSETSHFLTSRSPSNTRQQVPQPHAMYVSFNSFHFYVCFWFLSFDFCQK